jgi:hypothetical protein
MTKKFLSLYNEQLKSIENDEDTIAIFLVGSSKNINFEDENINIKDVDLFIISNQKENQIRDIKLLEGIELDINKFSIEYANYMIENKEYFFINEMKDAKVIYGKESTAYRFINLSKIKYDEGPKKIFEEEISVLSSTIHDNISRLGKKDNFESCEYEFLTNIYLKDIIKGYFIKNRKWMPKDKKIFKYLSENEKYLFKLVKSVYKDYEYNNLKKVYEYVFSK